MHELNKSAQQIQLPILVYASAGCGGSMLIWIIKNILYPDYQIDDPIDAHGSAHKQPLLQHWFGNPYEFDEIIHNVPEREKIIHCEPNFSTIAKALTHVSFLIHFETQAEIEQAIVFCKSKIPWFENKSIDNVKDLISLDPCTQQPHHATCNIPFKLLFEGDINTLLQTITDHLKVPCIKNYAHIFNIVEKWRKVNNDILQHKTHRILGPLACGLVRTDEFYHPG